MTQSLSADAAAFLARSPAVRFGDFTLKSGKKDSVFFNFGDLASGKDLSDMGALFARAIVDNGWGDTQVLFGPAYKGIVIAAATSLALWRDHGIDMPIAHDRKEAKTHGEGGTFVGTPLKGKSVLLIDDVMTDGGTKHTTIAALRAIEGVTVRALVIGVNRQDKDDSGKPYFDSFAAQTGVPVAALTTREEILKLRR
jgi:orotate phosphoribosyltransferase